MENKEIFDEFFEYASKNYLEKLFRIDNKSIFLKDFDEAIIKNLYLKVVDGIRQILNQNMKKKGDKLLFNTLNEISKTLCDDFEHEIKSATLKANLSPQVKVESKFDKNTARINLTKLKIVNGIYLFFLYKNESGITEFTIEMKKTLTNLFESLVESCNMSLSNHKSIIKSFIQEIIYEILELEENKNIVKILEDIFNELQLDQDIINILKNRKIISSVKRNNLFPENLFPINEKFNCEIEKNENSLINLDKDNDNEKNNKIEKYFKPVDKSKIILKFNSSIFTRKTLTKSENTSLKNENSNNINTSLKNENSNNTSSFATFTATENLNTQNADSVEISQVSQIGINSYSYTGNILFSANENSKSLIESTIKRPFSLYNSYNNNLNSSGNSNMKTYYNSNSINLSSTSKSSVSSLNVSQFSFNPANQINKSGINSLLASKLNDLPKTKKNNSRVLSNKKRKCKEKVILVEKLKEKIGKNNLSNKKCENVDKNIDRINLKKIIDTKFYKKLDNDIDKSPDLNEKDELLLKKRNLNRSGDSKKSRNRNSRSMSFTDDEILAYQTPVKISNFEQNKNVSPGTMTRKNLFHLFRQIDKSS